jgi:hypothetical protein
MKQHQSVSKKLEIMGGRYGFKYRGKSGYTREEAKFLRDKKHRIGV